jgi:hypothetical protein
MLQKLRLSIPALEHGKEKARYPLILLQKFQKGPAGFLWNASETRDGKRKWSSLPMVLTSKSTIPRAMSILEEVDHMVNPGNGYDGHEIADTHALARVMAAGTGNKFINFVHWIKHRKDLKKSGVSAPP